MDPRYPSAAITEALCSQPDANQKYGLCAGLTFQRNLDRGNGFIQVPAAPATCDRGTSVFVVPSSGVLSYGIKAFPALDC